MMIGFVRVLDYSGLRIESFEDKKKIGRRS